MGHLIDFTQETRSRCCRFETPHSTGLTPEGKMRIVAAFLAVMLAIVMLMGVSRMQAEGQTVPTFFSMLFPQLIPSGWFEAIGAQIGAVLL